MVAVNLARLRRQIGEVINLFNSPVEFHQALQALFSLYANYSLRFGETAPVLPLIPMYHLPHPVTRQLYLDLNSQISSHPGAALALADELWTDTHYEIKQTAIYIIGEISVNNPNLILDRIQNWLTPELDQVLKIDLFSIGTHALQENAQQVWESWVFSLLSNHDPTYNSLGIQALAASIRRSNVKNLPAIFRLASPFIKDPHSAYENDLETLICRLAKISPQETGFYLRQTLSISVSSETSRLLKNCLECFPADIQAELKAVLAKEK